MVISSSGTLVGVGRWGGRLCSKRGKLTIGWARSRHVITLRGADVDGWVRWRATWQGTSGRRRRGHGRGRRAIGDRSSRRTWRLRATAWLWWCSRIRCLKRVRCWRGGIGCGTWWTRVSSRVGHNLCSGLTFLLAFLSNTSVPEPDLRKNKTKINICNKVNTK
jgi:hypothetical protein